MTQRHPVACLDGEDRFRQSQKDLSAAWSPPRHSLTSLGTAAASAMLGLWYSPGDDGNKSPVSYRTGEAWFPGHLSSWGHSVVFLWKQTAEATCRNVISFFETAVSFFGYTWKWKTSSEVIQGGQLHTCTLQACFPWWGRPQTHDCVIQGGIVIR